MSNCYANPLRIDFVDFIGKRGAVIGIEQGKNETPVSSARQIGPGTYPGEIV